MLATIHDHARLPRRRSAVQATTPSRRDVRLGRTRRIAAAVTVGTMAALVLPAATSQAASTTVQVVPVSDGTDVTNYETGGALAFGQTLLATQDMDVTSASLTMSGLTDLIPELSICGVVGAASLPDTSTCVAAPSTSNLGGTIVGSFGGTPRHLASGTSYAVIVRAKASLGGLYAYYSAATLTFDTTTAYTSGHMLLDFENTSGLMDDFWGNAVDYGVVGVDTADLPLSLTFTTPDLVAPTITTTTLPNGTVGQPYTRSLTGTGTPDPTWSVTTGALPAGLTLSSTGVISGTPTAATDATFTVTAGNGTAPDATQELTLMIEAVIPGSPASVTLTPSAHAITADWPASTSTGGATVTYDVEYRATGDAGWTPVTNTASLTCTITSLTPGTEYTVRVRGMNAAGPATAWTTSAALILPDVPSINGVSVAESDEGALFQWTQAANGAAIDTATVQYRLSGAPSWTTDTFPAAGGIGARALAGLTNRARYDYSVTVHNAIGDSAAATGTFTPFTLAGAFASHGEVLNARARVAGDPVNGLATGVPTGRTVELVYAPGTSDEAVLGGVVAGSDGVATVDGTLPVGAAVGARTVGLRVVGTSALVTSSVTIVLAASATWTPARATYHQPYTSAITLGGTGAAVTDVTGLPAALSWNASGTVSGTPSVVGTFPLTVTVTGDSGTVTLHPTLTVDATTPGTVSAPVVSGGTSQPGELHVQWLAPTSVGAPGALTYTVRYRLLPSGSWSTVPATTATSVSVTSVPLGGTYEAEVTATNTSGMSSAPVTATGDVWVASVVSSLTARPADASVSLTWTTFTGGFTVETYVVGQSTAGGPVTTHDVKAVAPATTVTGLTNGTSYTFTVAACTVFVVGDPCVVGTPATVTVTPSTVPGAPSIGTATPGDGEATVTWQAPVSDGGSALSGYRVDHRITGSSTWTQGAVVAATATQATVTGLTNAAEYGFRVVAINAAGDGPASQPTTTIPFRFAPGYTAADGSPVDLTTMTAGTVLTMTGSGATPGATITLELHSTPILLGSTVVAADGTYRLTVTLPAGVTGSHTLVATMTGVTPVATAVDVVSPGAASGAPTTGGPTTASGAGVLATTGTDAVSAVIAALALMVGGAAAVVVARARRSRAHG